MHSCRGFEHACDFGHLGKRNVQLFGVIYHEVVLSYLELSDLILEAIKLILEVPVPELLWKVDNRDYKG